MATIQDLERKHNRFITSQNDIVDMIASYGVEITKETPFQHFSSLVKETVATKLEGILDGTTSFELIERDFEKITIVRRYAFYQNAALINLVIPECVTSIDPNAFYGCTGLITVRIPKAIRLQAGCFKGCTALEKFYLPDVTSVDELPTLVNISALEGINTACQFIAPSQDALAFYSEATNWNMLCDSYEFTLEGATTE